MEKNYGRLVDLYTCLFNQVKDMICSHMKELLHIKFNYKRMGLPFMDSDGEFESVDVVELKYEEGFRYDDVIVVDEYGNEWSVQEDSTVDGCMELLYYIEEEAYELIKV